MGQPRELFIQDVEALLNQLYPLVLTEMHRYVACRSSSNVLFHWLIGLALCTDCPNLVTLAPGHPQAKAISDSLDARCVDEFKLPLRRIIRNHIRVPPQLRGEKIAFRIVGRDIYMVYYEDAQYIPT